MLVLCIPWTQSSDAALGVDLRGHLLRLMDVTPDEPLRVYMRSVQQASSGSEWRAEAKGRLVCSAGEPQVNACPLLYTSTFFSCIKVLVSEVIYGWGPFCKAPGTVKEHPNYFGDSGCFKASQGQGQIV